MHDFERREIAVSRWRGEISISATISKTLLTPRDTNDSYPMPDSMARAISRFLHVRASTLSIISMFLISHQIYREQNDILTYIYKLLSFISGYFIKIDENTRVKKLFLGIKSMYELLVWFRHYFWFLLILERMVFWNIQSILKDSSTPRILLNNHSLNSIVEFLWDYPSILKLKN